MIIQVPVTASVSMGTSRRTTVRTHSVEWPLLNERSPVRASFFCNSGDMEVDGGGAWPRSSLRFCFKARWTSKVKHCASAIGAKPHLVRRPHKEANTESC
jgi:hypothetical protein